MKVAISCWVKIEGAGLAFDWGELVVLEADQAVGHGERQAATVGVAEAGFHEAYRKLSLKK
jgi:hypothetical protein